MYPCCSIPLSSMEMCCHTQCRNMDNYEVVLLQDYVQGPQEISVDLNIYLLFLILMTSL